MLNHDANGCRDTERAKLNIPEHDDWGGPWEINPNLTRLENYNIAEKANLNDALPGSNIWPYDLAFDRNNNAWVATNKGVAVYNKEGIEF